MTERAHERMSVYGLLNCIALCHNGFSPHSEIPKEFVCFLDVFTSYPILLDYSAAEEFPKSGKFNK